MAQNPYNKVNYAIDTSIASAFAEIIEGEWDFDIFSVELSKTLDVSLEKIFNYFVDTYNLNYRVFYGSRAYLWSDTFSILIAGDMNIVTATGGNNNNFNDEILISGRIDKVKAVVDAFIAHFKDNIIEDHYNVDWVYMGPQGLTYTSMPVKNRQKFYPEMYPFIPDVDVYIDDFINSSANVLILTGPPGLGKSAFINHLIMRAKVKTQVVYDQNVMKTDELYSSFVSRTMRDNGGLMVLEDADLILKSREFSENDVMSKLLNISDGIIDTSKAKFIFTANINNISDIDEALTRPGRCYDILQFRHLTLDEADKASAAINVALPGDKDEYTVAEIFMGKIHENKVGKLGFF